MAEKDWSQEKSIADEAHFNEFVVLHGGELIAPHIERQNIKNADYLFRAARIVGEHKILESDFAQTPETLEKVDAIFAKYAGEDLTAESHPVYRELFSVLRTPIRRRIEKANKQIKGAKKELGLVDHRGIIFLVNDNFRSAPPGLVMNLIRSVLAEKERYRSVDAVVYMTNHFVEIAESPYAGPLWAPAYKGYPSDQLVKFIDRLGSQWTDFMEDRMGPFDGGWKGPAIDWDRTYVVTGVNRSERYEGDD